MSVTIFFCFVLSLLTLELPAQIDVPEKSWVKMDVPTGVTLLRPDEGDLLDTSGNYPGSSSGDVRFAYDPVTQTILMFGGDTYSSYRRDTWSLSLSARRWTRLQLDNDVRAPFGRCQPGITFADHLGTMIMAGGIFSRAYQEGHPFGGVWQWDHGALTWKMASTGYPPGMSGGDFRRNLAYDPKNKKAVIYTAGSDNAGHIYAFDFESKSWEVKTHGSQPISGSWSTQDGSYNLAYDHARKFFLYVGRGTWKYVYETNTWTQLSGSSPAGGGQDTRLMYDPHNQVFMMYSGGSAMHVFDPGNNSWSSFSGGQAPPGRAQRAGAFDIHNNCGVVWGGSSGTQDGGSVYVFRYKDADVSTFETSFYGTLGQQPLSGYNSAPFIGTGNKIFCWFDNLVSVELERTPRTPLNTKRMRLRWSKPVHPFNPDPPRKFYDHFRFSNGHEWIRRSLWYTVICCGSDVPQLDTGKWYGEKENFFVWNKDSTEMVWSTTHFGESSGPTVVVGDQINVGDQCPWMTIQGADQILLPGETVVQEAGSVSLAAGMIWSAGPNPFTEGLSVSLETGEAFHIRLELFSVNGRKMGTLYEGPLAAGQHRVPWTAMAPPGLYLLKLTDGSGQWMAKRVLKN